MRTRFLFSALMLWLSQALLGLSEARASHAQAGELTYFSLGNNQYRVRATLFQDCGSAANPGSLALTCRNTCAGGPTVTASLQLLTGTANTGSRMPYCASSPSGSSCGTVYNNYEATVTLPPAAEWILSVEESARPAVANIAASDLRLEATLNNLITPTGGAPVAISNNSPQFNWKMQPVAFVCWREQASISFSATDADRLNSNQAGQFRPDSLVYTLDRPLAACGAYTPWSVYPNYVCNPVLDPRCPTRIIPCPTPAPAYSASHPITVTYDTLRSGPCLPGTITYATMQPHTRFNASNGTFMFTPALYSPMPNATQNKYVVVGKVTEYRKIGSRYYKVGSVRRDFLVIVNDCGSNLPPQPLVATITDTITSGGYYPGLDTTFISVRTCNYTRVLLRFTDPNATDFITVTPPADLNTTLLQNGDIGTFGLSGNGTARPWGTFHLQPSVSLAGTTVYATFRLEDNGCPMRRERYHVVAIRVLHGRSLRINSGINASSVSGVPPTTCTGAGTSVLLMGSVQRPDTVRNMAAGTNIAQVYSYQWFTSSGSGLPAITNTRSIQVNPAVTTRYHLRATPTLGFAPGCGDTISVLVRVVPQPQAPTVTQVGGTLMSSAASGNQWFLNGQPIAGATGSTYTPTAPGNYSVVTSVGTGLVRCSSLPSSRAAVLGTAAAALATRVQVAPNPTPDGRVRVQLTGYERPVTLRVHDALGQVVLTTQVAAPNPAGTEQVLHLPGTAAGVYVLQVVGATGVQIIRLVRE